MVEPQMSEGDLHRFAIGGSLHNIYNEMQEEYAYNQRTSFGFLQAPYGVMRTLHTMIKSQSRGHPDILQRYNEKMAKMNSTYGDVDSRDWNMTTSEATRRKEALEDFLNELGVTRIDERPEAPERKVYDFAYSYDGRKLVYDLFQDRLKENRNLVVLFSGKTGGGKSYASLSIADFLVPSLNVGFEMESLVYSIPDFIERIKKQEPGTAIILDEAGISAGSRDAMTKESKVLGKTIQSIRYLKHCTVFTLPNANFLDKQVRLLIDVVFDHTEDQRQGEFTPYIPVISPDGKDVALSPFTIRNRVVRSVYFPLPRPSLVVDYETKRRTHNMEQLNELQDTLKPKKEEEKDGRGRSPNSLRNLRPFKDKGGDEK